MNPNKEKKLKDYSNNGVQLYPKSVADRVPLTLRVLVAFWFFTVTIPAVYLTKRKSGAG